MESENITPQEGSREGYEGKKKNESREASSKEDSSKTYRPRTAKKFTPSNTSPSRENTPPKEVTNDSPKSTEERSSGKERPFWTDFSGKEDRPARSSRSSEDSSFGEKKPYERRERSSRDDRPARESRPFERKERSGERSDRPFNRDNRSGERSERPFNRDNRSGDRNDRPFNRDNRSGEGSDKPFNRDNRSSERSDRPFNRDNRSGERSDRPFNRDNRSGERSDRPFNRDNRSGERSDRPFNRDNRSSERSDKPFRRSDSGDKPFRGDRSFDREDRPNRSDKGEEKGSRPFSGERTDHFTRSDRPFLKDRPERRERSDRDGARGERPFRGERSSDRNGSRYADRGNTPFNRSDRPKREVEGAENDGDQPKTEFTSRRKHIQVYEPKSYEEEVNKPIRLNRYISNAGICSRREADTFIQAGVVSINGTIVTELGTKVNPTDEVRFNDEPIKGERKVYLLLNKPKDYITTTDDPNARQTVMEIVAGACKERIYPVGRLDRNTTGVLLMTNDGELATRLLHPSSNKKKVYHIHLDKKISTTDLEKICEGVELEDGMAYADSASIVADDPKQVGIEIHSGKNRIVRRIFEHLNYNVVKLDRVYFAGLTKKGLGRGEYRMLNDKEVEMMKRGAYE
ncbi:MAG TPA: pseudouridine synthase [Williamwhitmania sp.]|nr:pseudouridine synthase [Williamwhitmania sp.]